MKTQVYTVQSMLHVHSRDMQSAAAVTPMTYINIALSCNIKYMGGLHDTLVSFFKFDMDSTVDHN